MTVARPYQQGFSTVELLIALFIAAAFVGTGFQLYLIVTKDGNEARLRSRASNVAYENIRLNTSEVGAICSPPRATIHPAPPADLPNAAVAISFSCPYGPSSTTTRVTATVTYGTPQQTLEESIDVAKP